MRWVLAIKYRHIYTASIKEREREKKKDNKTYSVNRSKTYFQTTSIKTKRWLPSYTSLYFSLEHVIVEIAKLDLKSPKYKHVLKLLYSLQVIPLHLKKKNGSEQITINVRVDDNISDLCG